MHELGDGPEMSFKDVLSEAGPCDLILVEGFKREAFLEDRDPQGGAVSRGSLSLAQLPEIVAVASDRPGMR